LNTRRTNVSRRSLSALVIAGAIALTLAGCQSGNEPGGDVPANLVNAELPTYAAAAARYNANTGGLERIFVGGAVVRVTFPDERGVSQREQVEGSLQLIRPSRVALNIRKVGQPLFWLGSDDTRYWWFDLTGETKYAVIGRHDLFRQEQATKIGLSVHPLELVRLLGVMPLPTDAGTLGGTQWSTSRAWLGISTPLTDAPGNAGGYQRIWVDPETFLVQQVDLLNSERELVLTATHSEHASVTMTDQPVGPMLAGRIVVRHLPSGSVLDLSMPNVTDGRRRISDKAFVFDEVAASLKPDKTYDLDRAPAARPEGPVPPPAE